jgi:hypothetical protein
MQQRCDPNLRRRAKAKATGGRRSAVWATSQCGAFHQFHDADDRRPREDTDWWS